jgi:hypothetical protein
MWTLVSSELDSKFLTDILHCALAHLLSDGKKPCWRGQDVGVEQEVEACSEGWPLALHVLFSGGAHPLD